MSEFYPSGPSPEQHNSLPSPERHERLALPTAEQAEHLRKGEKDPIQTLAEARAVINEIAEAQPAAVQERLHSTESGQPVVNPGRISKSLEKLGVDRELFAIRRRLNAPQRAASKVIHQPVVRVVSQAASSTVSRPSGIFGGSLLAFIGTSGYLYLAKHLGFQYNFGVFIVLFLSGFILGLLAELLVHFALNTRHHRKVQSA